MLIKEMSFTLEQGASTVILGHNGAGKSLLLRLCHGLVRPTSGRIEWLGAKNSDATIKQAMVFQRPVMLRRTAAQNVDYALRTRGIAKEQRNELVNDALRRTKLHRHADRPARVLSFGEQQRLAMARAWALRPDILFLDEPTASLDPAVTRSIEELIDAIRAEGTKIVMTTHDLGQAKRMADEIMFLHRGRIVEKGPADKMLSAPDSDAARAFIAGDLFW